MTMGGNFRKKLVWQNVMSTDSCPWKTWWTRTWVPKIFGSDNFTSLRWKMFVFKPENDQIWQSWWAEYQIGGANLKVGDFIGNFTRDNDYYGLLVQIADIGLRHSKPLCPHWNTKKYFNAHLRGLSDATFEFFQSISSYLDIIDYLGKYVNLVKFNLHWPGGLNLDLSKKVSKYHLSSFRIYFDIFRWKS